MMTPMTPLACLLWLSPAWAADPRVRVDNDLARVLLVSNSPGQKSRLHKHDVNRVMIHLDPGVMRLTDEKGGARDVKFRAGEVRWDPAGGLHTSENVGPTTYRIVEVELKKPGGAAVTYPPLDPVKADPKHYRVEFENDQVRVTRARIGGKETAPLHEHALPRIVTTLTEMRVRQTAPDGTTKDVAERAGEVFTAGAAKHVEVNLSEQPMEVVVVELKSK